MEDTYSSYFFDTPESGSPEAGPFYSYTEEDEPWYSSPVTEKKKKSNLWMIRILLSLFLLSASYLITTWNIPQTKPYQDLIKEVLNRSYNFSAMSAWYEDKFGALPAMLPSLGSLSNQAQPVLQQGGKPSLLKGPVSGKMKPTQTPENGIYILTVDPMVKSIDRGKVIFVGEKTGMGKTVVIQHSQGLESWYGNLDNYSVSLNDWVEVQQPIGKTPAATSMEQGVYFAIKKDGKFVDPGSVAQIE